MQVERKEKKLGNYIKHDLLKQERKETGSGHAYAAMTKIIFVYLTNTFYEVVLFKKKNKYASVLLSVIS